MSNEVSTRFKHLESTSFSVVVFPGGPSRGVTAGQGMGFWLSLLNRVYNFYALCSKRGMVARLSSLNVPYTVLSNHKSETFAGL